MKKLNFIIIFLFLSAVLKAQPEFKISIEEFYWGEPNNKDMVNLQINIKVKNIGNQSGKCEDLKEIWLFSSSEIDNSQIRIVKNGTYLFNEIKPNDFIDGFVTFDVPRSADNLELKFSEETGGAKKYITESYNKYISKNTKEKTDKEKLLGDQYFNDKNYTSAIERYAMATKYDKTRKKEFDTKISECYLQIANNNWESYKSNSYQTYLDKYLENMRLALEYDNSNITVKSQLASYYAEKGDQFLKEKKNNDAINEYKNSLKYSESSIIRGKIKNIESDEAKKRNEIEKKRLALENYNNLIQPKVGINFTAGMSMNSNSKSNSNLYFWNVQLDIPIKLATLKPPSPTFSFLLNIDAGYQGALGNADDASKYFNITNSYGNDYLIKPDNKIMLGEGYINPGIGVAFLNKHIIPFFCAYYGLYAQHSSLQFINLNSNSNISEINKNLEKVQLGHGFKLETGFMIGKRPGFILSYSFRNYSINSKVDFLDNTYTSHLISLGITNF